MTEVSYKIWNRSFGLIIFLVALITFSLTVEPTASFWDAGEYISTSAKLQIGHPPGAPFYQMLGAFFALFSGSAEKIALSVNFMSVLSSAFAVLFLFWTLTLLLKKIPAFDKLDNLSKKVSFFIAQKTPIGTDTKTAKIIEQKAKKMVFGKTVKIISKTSCS